MLKIATWNVNSIHVRLPHISDWLQAHQPDILALQETKVIDEKFPLDTIQDMGYQAVFAGQKTYNGVAILSKQTLTEISTDIPGFADVERRILAATYNDVRILNLYVPNGQSVDSEKYHYKLQFLAHVRDYLEQQLAQYDKLLVLGDFNIAPEDRDVHDPKVWEGSVLVSAKERDALQRLLDLGLHDGFRLFEQEAGHFSWWDYRAGAFRRKHGLRIDLILLSSALSTTCQACYIDSEPRRWQRPSDHTIVCAEFVD